MIDSIPNILAYSACSKITPLFYFTPFQALNNCNSNLTHDQKLKKLGAVSNAVCDKTGIWGEFLDCDQCVVL